MEEDEYEADVIAAEEIGTGTVTVFFHTGAPSTVSIPLTGMAVTPFRETVQVSTGNSTAGLDCIVQGTRVLREEEDECMVTPGNVVVFSGNVKGG